ncbi:MAG: HRDC domain-containing protein [Anaerolineales bacterium]
MTPLPPPAWIAAPHALTRLAEELSRQPRLAVDTESNSLHAYREQVCLLQFSTPQADYLVDPLALKDLSPLAALFADPAIEKVFHAVEYDLIGLRRDYGITIVNLFDTMQAARILGYKRVGLDSLLNDKFGLQMNKRYQKADWARRPLPPDLLNYARLDTHYLLDLRDILQAELMARGLWPLALEEFARLALGNGNNKHEEAPWQKLGRAHHLDGQQLAILQELWEWREARARRLNRPVFKILGEKWLIALAQKMPRGMEDLNRLGLTGHQIHAYGRDLLAAVERGRQAAPLRHTRPSRPSQAYLDRLEALSQWRKGVARKMGVDSDIVLPRPFMHAIAERAPQTPAELAAAMPNAPWRIERFGADILAVVQKKK